jgi:predicted RNase H-like HicB family nuclease
MNFHIEYEREDDGRWLAEVPEVPGAMAYGAKVDEAMDKAEALMFRILAERIETGENRSMPITITNNFKNKLR